MALAEDVVAEHWWRMVEEGSEEARMAFARLLLTDPDRVLGVVAKRVGGEWVPDTVIAGRALEVVVAALSLRRQEGKKLRLVLPRDPVPGWAPLLMVSEDLAIRGLVEVYRVPFTPSHKPTAREVYRRAVRVFKGFSAGVADVTDASPVLAIAAHSVARYTTVLVFIGHAAVFQRI